MAGTTYADQLAAFATYRHALAHSPTARQSRGALVDVLDDECGEYCVICHGDPPAPLEASTPVAMTNYMRHVPPSDPLPWTRTAVGR